MKLRENVIKKKTNILQEYKRNNKKHPKKQINILAENIKRFGFTTPILIDQKNIVIAGHARLIAARQLNMKEVPCILIDDLTESEVKALRIADNKIAAMSEDDMVNLQEEYLELREEEDLVSLVGWDDEELRLVDNDKLIDDTVEVEGYLRRKVAKYQVKPGEVWKLGEHLLMCGDATKRSDEEILMKGQKANLILTDPPYGMSFGANPYEGGNRGTGGKAARVKAWGKLKNDELEGEKLTEFLAKGIENHKNSSEENAPLYLWGTWRNINNFTGALGETKTEITSLIVWNKESIGLGYSNYKPMHEFLFYSNRGGHWYGGLKQGDVWNLTRGNLQAYEHPTMKPLELISKMITNSSKKGELVIDFFGGSGTTLIAAEQLSRKCYMMEIDPFYCSVIIERWENLTGQKARKS